VAPPSEGRTAAPVEDRIGRNDPGTARLPDRPGGSPAHSSRLFVRDVTPAMR